MSSNSNDDFVEPEFKLVTAGEATEGVHFSDWFITYNSNLSAVGLPSGTVARYHFLMTEALRCTIQPKNYREIFQIYQKAAPGVELEARMIRRVKIEMAPEVGSHPQGSRIHLHALLKVEHTTYLRLNTERMREILRFCVEQVNRLLRAEGLPPFPARPYLNVKWVPSIKPYLRKMAAIYGEGAAILADFQPKPIGFWKTWEQRGGSKYEYPIGQQQPDLEVEAAAASKRGRPRKQKKKGRPKGSKNKKK